MEKRFLSKDSQLSEEWCAFVPGSEKSGGAFVLRIRDLIEATDQYEIYEAVDDHENIEGTFKIKVYLDSEVQAHGKLHLGKTTELEWDVNGIPVNKSCVFEIIVGWEEYLEVYRNEDDSCDDDFFEDDYSNICSNPSDNNHKTDESVTEDGPQDKGFAAVAGMEELKEQLRNEVLWPLKNKELMEKYRLHALNGMLLYGPPGCGKTYIAQRFAEESGMNFKFFSAGSLGSFYIHQTASNVKDMFEDAKKQAPCILCIDEIDSLLPDRSQVGVEGGCSDLVESVNEFLSRMNNCSKDGIFVIGSTNNPLALDAAVLRTGRMDKVIYVGLPDEESRKALIEYNLKGRPQEEGIDVGELAKIADGMNASDIEFMVNFVATQAAMNQVLITFEKLAEQAKTQRRSVYIPKETESEETTKSTPANTRIMGFAQFDSSDVKKQKVKCA